MLKKYLKLMVVKVLGGKRRVFYVFSGPLRGMKLYLDPRTELSNLYKSHEPHLSIILDKYVKKGDFVLDIGANLGIVSLALSKIVGVSGQVVSYEAIPSTAEIMRNNISNNHIQNIKLFNKAVSDEVTEVEFRVPNNGMNTSMASMIWHVNDENSIIYKVETVVLDNEAYVVKGRPSFVKIDVEGADYNVINGMRNILAQIRPIVYIECSEAYREKVWKIFIENNFECYRASALSESITDLEQYRSDDFLWIPKEYQSL